jgi:hypothetical protein
MHNQKEKKNGKSIQKSKSDQKRDEGQKSQSCQTAGQDQKTEKNVEESLTALSKKKIVDLPHNPKGVMQTVRDAFWVLAAICPRNRSAGL